VWWGILADVAVVLFVMSLGAKAAIGVAAVRDADLSDECYYLMSAAAIPERGLPGVENAPLYVLWDGALLRCGVAPEDVPVTSWACLAVLLSGAVSVLVRALGGGRLGALVAGGVLPATTLIDVYPYPMHLAALVLVLGTALAARQRAAAAGAVLGLTLLTATYARPEFLYALALYLPPALVGAGWALWRRPQARRAVLGSVLAFTCGAAILVWAFGSPKGNGGRSFIAFGQHYAANRHDAGARTEDQWHYWELYVRDDFGPATTVPQAWQNNRAAFLWHVETNARRTPEMLGAVAAPRVDLRMLRYPYFVPPDTPSRHPNAEALARWVMLAGLAFGLFGAGIRLRRWARGQDRDCRLCVALVMLVTVAVPALAAVLVVYPRFHYLIPTVVFGAAIAGAGARYLPFRGGNGRIGARLALVVAVVGLALVVPNRAKGWCIQSRLGKARQAQTITPMPTSIRGWVHTIRALGLHPPVRVLEVGSARAFYTGLGAGHVPPHEIRPGEGFLTFVERADIGLVILEPVLTECPQLHDDPDLRALMEGKESAKFRLFPLADYPFLCVAVRRDLLSQ
jgi:hypothetical protein